MKKENEKCCPYCGSSVKYALKPRNMYPHDNYMTPTIFQYGTVTSENWSPPVRDKNCIEKISYAGQKVQPETKQFFEARFEERLRNS